MQAGWWPPAVRAEQRCTAFNSGHRPGLAGVTKEGALDLQRVNGQKRVENPSAPEKEMF